MGSQPEDITWEEFLKKIPQCKNRKRFDKKFNKLYKKHFGKKDG